MRSTELCQAWLSVLASRSHTTDISFHEWKPFGWGRVFKLFRSWTSADASAKPFTANFPGVPSLQTLVQPRVPAPVPTAPPAGTIPGSFSVSPHPAQGEVVAISVTALWVFANSPCLATSLKSCFSPNIAFYLAGIAVQEGILEEDLSHHDNFSLFLQDVGTVCLLTWRKALGSSGARSQRVSICSLQRCAQQDCCPVQKSLVVNAK